MLTIRKIFKHPFFFLYYAYSILISSKYAYIITHAGCSAWQIHNTSYRRSKYYPTCSGQSKRLLHCWNSSFYDVQYNLNLFIHVFVGSGQFWLIPFCRNLHIPWADKTCKHHRIIHQYLICSFCVSRWILFLKNLLN